jgi:hypothetical protein
MSLCEDLWKAFHNYSSRRSQRLDRVGNTDRSVSSKARYSASFDSRASRSMASAPCFLTSSYFDFSWASLRDLLNSVS